MTEAEKRELESIVSDLYFKKYTKLLEENKLHNFSIEDIVNVIELYGGDISLPPSSSYSKAVVYECNTEFQEEKLIEYNLWFEGKESDLTLIVRFVMKNSQIVACIEDLRVM
jgi:hypothetical protein